VDVAVTEDQLRLVLDKLDMVKLEILRLRAMLLPEEELSEKERKELEEARKEIAEGSSVELEDLIKELGSPLRNCPSIIDEGSELLLILR